MKLVLLLGSIMAIGQSFAQQSAHSLRPQDAEAVVTKLYKQVVHRKPIGIPRKVDREAIWPFLSGELIESLDTAQKCEQDYFRQYSDPSLKPSFDWLEMGLFSGGNEEALPSRMAVRRTLKQKDGSYQVEVKLTYKETFETYGRPPDPKNAFNWDVIAFVIWDMNKFAVNDVLYAKEHSDEAELRLSQLLRHGCKDGKWIGDAR